MTPLRREDVAHVARLARLTLSEAELDLFTVQLGQVLEHANDMANLDLTGVVPTAHPFGLINVVRADVVRPSLDRDAVLAEMQMRREPRRASDIRAVALVGIIIERFTQETIQFGGGTRLARLPLGAQPIGPVAFRLKLQIVERERLRPLRRRG